jgi:hypothetical protein
VAALVAAAGVLLIEGETADLVFLVLLCVAVLAWGAVIERREASEPRGEGWTFLVPLLLALAASRAFGSADARLAALFLLAVTFAFGWSLVLRRWRARGRG